MRREAKQNPQFERMQGKAALVAILALVVIALGVFMFATPPQLPGQTGEAPVEAAQEMAGGAETAGTINLAAIPDEDEDDSTPAAEDGTTAEQRLAAAREQETAVPNVEPAASADAAPARTEDADEVESLLSAPKVLTVNILRALDDRVIGRDDAPVTIIEYASLTCPHCAKFHNTILPAVKRELIDTGKARMIFRDYPIDTHVLRAAMMARCAPNEKYFDLIEVLFRNQDKWTKSDNPTRALAQYGNLAGMDDEFIAACMTNAELEGALLKRQRDAQTLYRVRSTPTFIFNLRGQENVRQLVGPDNAPQVIETVNKLLGMR